MLSLCVMFVKLQLEQWNSWNSLALATAYE